MTPSRAPLLLSCAIAFLAPCPARAQGAGKAQPPLEPVTTLTTESGVRFGVWPKVPDRPASTVFVLASTIEETLGSAYYRQCGNQLAGRGFVCVSVDLPCHGRERRGDEPAGIDGWRRRCERGEDFVAELVARLGAVLDHLVAKGMTDPARVAACGTSRGGFSALHFAAADRRVRGVAAFGPVIDLGVLREFRGIAADPAVARLSLRNRLDDLAGRAAWLVIGDRDERVRTDDTVRFARDLTALSLLRQKSPRVDLLVLAEPRGHTTPAGSPEIAAAWIARQVEAGEGGR